MTAPAHPGRLRRWSGAVLPWIACAASGTVVGFAARGESFGRWLEWVALLRPVDVAGFAVVGLGCILVHEAGHALVGLARGAQLLMLAVWPLRLTRGADGWHLASFFRNGGFGGLTVMLPDLARPLPPQLWPMIAGGPVASALLAIAAAAAAFATDGRIALYAAATAVISLLLFALTAWPFRVQGFANDAMQLLELRRGGRGVEFRHVLLALAAASFGGRRPRELDRELLARAFALDDGANPLLTASAHQLAMLAADDAGDDATRDAHRDAIVAAFDALPQGLRQGMAIDLAILAAVRDGDPAAARDWLRRGEGGLVEPAHRATARAALAAGEQRHAEARTHAERAHTALPRHFDHGHAAWLRDLLANVVAPEIGH